MNKNDLIHAAIRIFGVWIAIQAVIEGIGFASNATSCLLFFNDILDFFRHSQHSDQGDALNKGFEQASQMAVRAVLQGVAHAALHAIGYTLLAIYLLRGAPHLVRFMKIEKTEN